MRIWVDGDSCPRELRKILLRGADRLGVGIFFVADRDINIRCGRGVEMILLPAGPDAVDSYIEARAAAGDLAVTRDILLAGRLSRLGVTVINNMGVEFTASNLPALERRRELRLGSVQLGWESPKRGNPAKNHHSFAQTFHSCLERLAGGKS